MKEGNNPFAFPRAEGETTAEQDGMTLRDYFAAQIVGSLLMIFRGSDETYSDIVRYAYEMADAMLDERAKGGVK